jgi:hypothetical protein
MVPDHYVLRHEVMLETTSLTVDEAITVETVLCRLYRVEWLESAFEPETKTEWTILRLAA